MPWRDGDARFDTSEREGVVAADAELVLPRSMLRNLDSDMMVTPRAADFSSLLVVAILGGNLPCTK